MGKRQAACYFAISNGVAFLACGGGKAFFRLSSSSDQMRAYASRSSVCDGLRIYALSVVCFCLPQRCCYYYFLLLLLCILSGYFFDYLRVSVMSCYNTE